MSEAKENIILGIDPGTTVMGYGLIMITGKKINVLQFGVLNLSGYRGQAVKLRHIFEMVQKLIEDFNPDFMALEAPFYGKNIQSMLKLGRAQGVAMAAALSFQIPIHEYAPRKIKQSVTGNGNASKEQVAGMLKSLLKLDDQPRLFDATDALAVALCHYYQKDKPVSKGNSWSAFLKDNPDRKIR